MSKSILFIFLFIYSNFFSQVCFTRMFGAHAEAVIPVSQWSGQSVDYRVYNLAGGLVTAGSVLASSLPRVVDGGVAKYDFQIAVGTGDWNQPYIYEVGSPTDSPVSQLLQPRPQSEWNSITGCIPRKVAVCFERNNQEYKIYIPVAQWGASSATLRIYDTNGSSVYSTNTNNMPTENYLGTNSYLLSGTIGDPSTPYIYEVSTAGVPATFKLMKPVDTQCVAVDGCSSNAWLLGGNALPDDSSFIGTTNAVDFVVKTNNTERMRISKEGVVSMGSFGQQLPLSAGYRLYVKDGIRTENLKVDIASANNWADYVFSPDYKLMNIRDLEKYVGTHRHLPGIPSSEEVARDGIDVAGMSAKLLEKIEEATLHIIKQDKDIRALEQENKILRESASARAAKIDKLLNSKKANGKNLR